MDWGMYNIGGHQMSESNCQCGRTHAKGCRCSCGGHENVYEDEARIEYRDGTVEVAKVPESRPHITHHDGCECFQRAWYERGQMEMRERAAKEADKIAQETLPDPDDDLVITRCAALKVAKAIRSIPI